MFAALSNLVPPRLMFLTWTPDLFRWNRQINLVSRQETEDKLEGLFNQCVGGAGSISDVIAPLGNESASNLFYFDLGSGGGLPGIIWHILFSEMSN